MSRSTLRASVRPTECNLARDVAFSGLIDRRIERAVVNFCFSELPFTRFNYILSSSSNFAEVLVTLAGPPWSRTATSERVKPR